MFKDRILPDLVALAAEAGIATPPTPLEAEVVAVFDEMRERLMRYLLSIGLSAPDGEEIVQEVFLALFQHLKRGKSRSNLRGWVFRVAHNLAVKRHSARRRDRQNLAEPGAVHAADVFIDPAPNPEDQLAQTQRHAHLQNVLRALPERDRQCLSLRAEGLTYREIAEVLDVSLGAVALSLGASLARFARADER
jgi:RNA polymerase sigma-70 factor (ECF subfamily)